MAAHTSFDPPSALALVDNKAMTTIKLDLTPVGIRAFKITFPAALGPLLGSTLKYALQHNLLDPTDTKTETLHGYIFNYLATIVGVYPTVLIDMTDECGELGPKCCNWLYNKYNPAVDRLGHQAADEPSSSRAVFAATTTSKRSSPPTPASPHRRRTFGSTTSSWQSSS